MKIIIVRIDRKRKQEFNHILTVIGSKILQGIMQEYWVWPDGSNQSMGEVFTQIRKAVHTVSIKFILT